MPVRLSSVPARILGEVRLMKAISACLIRAVPKLPFVGVCCRSWGGLALANAAVREQSSVRKPVILGGCRFSYVVGVLKCRFQMCRRKCGKPSLNGIDNPEYDCAYAPV